MKNLTLLFLLLALPAAASDFPAVDGWALASEVTAKSPDNLWEYNNGAAEAFLAYGFKGLRYADLKAGDVVVTAEIYDMGTPINAFGIYSTECSTDAERVDIAAEGALALPYQCLLLKDRHYVKLNLYQGELKKDAAVKLLGSLAAALPGTDGWPAELDLLPAEGRVTGSMGYTREAYLGMSVLRECVHADYVSGEKTFPRFIMLADTDKARRATWERMAAKWTAGEQKGQPVLWKKIPYQGITGVVLTARGIFGVSDCADEKQLMERLAAYVE